MAITAQTVGGRNAGRSPLPVATVIRFTGAATVSHPASSAIGQTTIQRSRSRTGRARMAPAFCNSGISTTASEPKISTMVATSASRAAATTHSPMPAKARAEGQPNRWINRLSPVCGRT